MEKTFFGNYNDKDVYAYTLRDEISVTIVTLGATIIKLEVPSKTGALVDVVLGMTNPTDVCGAKGDYMGCMVGRCGNRIAKGKFTLEGKNYQLDCNNGQNHLHGGFDGFHKKLYDVVSCDERSLTLASHSCDGDQGYPANVDFSVKYTVCGSALTIEYFGESDGTTIFNPTNHAYFNLNGQDDGSILDNVLQINANEYLEIDETLIPVKRSTVQDTPFDFRIAKPIGRDIDQNNLQLANGGGYDHNFCLSDTHFATAFSPKTGITMDCYTDLPGVQFYSGNFLCGNVGKAKYPKRSGFCLETQCWPDAINHADYKQPVLHKGKKFYSKTQYVFGVNQTK